MLLSCGDTRKGVLRQAFLFILLPAAFLFALRGYWGIYVEQRWQRARAALEKAAPPLPAPEPGAKTTAEMINWVWGENPFPYDHDLVAGKEITGDRIWHNEWTAEEDREIKRVLTASEPIFARLDAADDQRVAFTRYRDESEAVKNVAEAITRLEVLLAHRVRLAVEENRHADALLEIIRWERLNQMESHDAALTNGYLSDRAVHCLQAYLGRIRFQTEPARSRAEQLLKLLLKEIPTESYVRHEAGWTLANDLHPSMADSWWYHPLSQLPRILEYEFETAAIPAVLQPDWVKAKRTLDELSIGSAFSRLGQLFEKKAMGFFSDSRSNLIQSIYRYKSDRRAMTILLAARLHQAHTADFPDRAEQLVPTLLPQVPLDPFTEGRPLIYQLRFADLTVISVGPNGVDDSAGAPTLFDEMDFRYHAPKWFD